MDEGTGKLTVFFEEPFWVGVFERIYHGKLSVCKVTFGQEPKDYEVLECIQKNYDRLQFSPTVDVVVKRGQPIPNDCKEKRESRPCRQGSEQSLNRLYNNSGRKTS